MADLSLISFLKIICSLYKKREILKFRDNEKLKNRIPNYRVKIGFGLHVGWAIEGSIGSMYKIDASYLSPNVNMASRLEAATKQYGVNILISSDLQSIFSKKTKKYLREIDRITVKGSNRPIGIFTVDMKLDKLGPKKKNLSQIISKEEKREFHNFFKFELIKEIASKDIKANQIFQSDKSLCEVLYDPNVMSEFKSNFLHGFDNYINGNWESSKKYLEKTLDIEMNDGPTNVLLNYMKEREFTAPDNWNGYRALTDK